jgi:hypothetical protein
MKNLLLHHTIPKYNITKDIKTVLKKINSHKTTLSPENLAMLQTSVTKIRDYNAIVFMANALYYYQNHHSFMFKSKDSKIIGRALKKPQNMTFESLKTIYDYYLCGIEEVHHYYTKCKNQQKNKRHQIKLKKRKKYIGPYSLYIQQQWKERSEMLHKLKNEKSMPEVMRLLSQEWASNPDIKITYQKRAEQLNNKNIPVQPESSV